MSSDLQARLQRLIQGGETAQVEFKQQFTGPDKMAREISALANTAGGWLIVGVSDQGKILGVSTPEVLQKHLMDTCLYYLDPSVEAEAAVVDLQTRQVVVQEIPNSPHKPHRMGGQGRWVGQVYLRHGSFTVPASPEMNKILMSRDESQLAEILLDRLEQTLVEHVQEQDQITLKQYCREFNMSERRGHRILTQLLQVGVLNLFQHEREDYYGLNPLWLQRSGRTPLHL